MLRSLFIAAAPTVLLLGSGATSLVVAAEAPEAGDGCEDFGDYSYVRGPVSAKDLE